MINKHDFLLILTLRISKASGSYVIGQAENRCAASYILSQFMHNYYIMNHNKAN